MNPTSGGSTPRSSIDRAIGDVSVADSFSERIREALEHTAKDFATQDEKEAHCFLTTAKLNEILNRKTLAPLFEKLLEDFGVDSQIISPHLCLEIDSGTNRLTEACIKATVGNPSRRVLLALFLYLNEEFLYCKFIQWAISNNPETPSDNSMPFTRETLRLYGIGDKYHPKIIRPQAMFMPVAILKGQDTDLMYTQRLPFIGTHTHIEEGSSGTVFNVEIAPGYWHTKNVNGSFKPDDTHSSTVVAIKTFRESKIRNMDTKNDFETEREILRSIRGSNLRHNMVLLDWGSITEFDEAGRPIQYSLIFQLAKFNLAQFLQDAQRFRIYTKKSILIEKLVDIVEALEFLHDKLEVIHLDIKPENILVFEKESSRQDNDNRDQSKLALKLTDFGLSRKRYGKPRTGYKRKEPNNGVSQSFTTPAPRSAGTYQGPEIQARESSFARCRSDIWSIGCVALMMMAFIINGPDEVTKLQHKLSVDFKPRNGHETLFYIRSDTFAWNREDYRYQYLEDFEPDIAKIPRKEPPLQAAVHPQVIAWSNVIHTNYSGLRGGPLIKQYFEEIFRQALRISPTKRATAADLLVRLRKVQREWTALENSGASIDRPSATSRPHSLYDGCPDMQPERPQAPPHNGERSVATLPPSVPSTGQQVSEEAIFFSAIKKDNAVDVRRDLERTPQLMKSQSPESGAYPIQHAIIHERYEALKVLLSKADRGAMQQKSHGRNVLQQACAEPGDAKALRCLCEKARLIEFPKEYHKTHREKLKRDAKKAFDELYQKAKA